MQTRVLIAASNLVIAWWPILFGLPLIGLIGVGISMPRSTRLQYYWDRAKLNLPVVGAILQKIILARFANFFSTA